jgi:hypothetical protein
MAEPYVNDTLTHLLQPDTVLPSQFYAALRRKTEQEPERRLAVAVLQDAVECYQKYMHARDRKARQLYLDAETWILSVDRSWPFAFDNICELLQIDPEYLRRGLLQWRAQHDQAAGSNVIPLRPRTVEGAAADLPAAKAKAS